jgi:probable rRNA maturation factor
LAWERAAGARVDVTLLDAPAMRRLNRRVTGRRALTDVISFTLPQPNGSIVGDVYICPEAAERWLRGKSIVQRPRSPATSDRQRRPAAELEAEIRRLVVHGVLHVLGYDHPEGSGRTRSAMWRLQESYVRRLERRVRARS